MSIPVSTKRLTPLDIARRGKTATPLVALTAYTTPMATYLDPHCDIALVGDSLGMVVYGMESTLGVTLEMMIQHGAAVMRGAKRMCVVVDMPFGTYGESPAQAYRNAARIMAETGCSAVKLEGGRDMAETIAFLTARGIPVMGHIGLMPQFLHVQGGFRAQGRDDEGAANLRADALAVEQAGAFATVLEGTIEPLAREITALLAIPVIGIGASSVCDGQILVVDDLLGLFTAFKPRFVKRYAMLGEQVTNAVGRYADDVRARRFPADEHCFFAKPSSSPADEPSPKP